MADSYFLLTCYDTLYKIALLSLTFKTSDDARNFALSWHLYAHKTPWPSWATWYYETPHLQTCHTGANAWSISEIQEHDNG